VQVGDSNGLTKVLRGKGDSLNAMTTVLPALGAAAGSMSPYEGRSPPSSKTRKDGRRSKDPAQGTIILLQQKITALESALNEREQYVNALEAKMTQMVQAVEQGEQRLRNQDVYIRKAAKDSDSKMKRLVVKNEELAGSDHFEKLQGEIKRRGQVMQKGESRIFTLEERCATRIRTQQDSTFRCVAC
jgi:chromosome segregation ATPase